MKVLLVMAVALLVAGCPATRGVYEEAQSPDEYAFVVAEHYNALVNEAADLAENPQTSENVRSALKAADAKAKPLVLKLRVLADAYASSKTAETQEELQKALNEAVLAVADFIRSLRSAQAVTTGDVMPEWAGRMA